MIINYLKTHLILIYILYDIEADIMIIIIFLIIISVINSQSLTIYNTYDIIMIINKQEVIENEQ